VLLNAFAVSRIIAGSLSSISPILLGRKRKRKANVSQLGVQKQARHFMIFSFHPYSAEILVSIWIFSCWIPMAVIFLTLLAAVKGCKKILAEILVSVVLMNFGTEIEHSISLGRFAEYRAAEKSDCGTTSRLNVMGCRAVLRRTSKPVGTATEMSS
jgi:hypothetical protein